MRIWMRQRLELLRVARFNCLLARGLRTLERESLLHLLTRRGLFLLHLPLRERLDLLLMLTF
jgi:hypothetical protein